MCYDEPDMSEIEDIARAIAPVLDAYGVEKAILFGSLARGRATARSDVDLILVKRTEERFLDRTRGLLRDLHRAIRGRGVDVLVYTPEELLGIAHRAFIATALAEGKIVYERGQAA
jgi:predicted nucleotidyltransferase